MKASVNVMALPSGERIVTDGSDTAAKAEALRLGLLPAISRALRRRTGERCAAAVTRDGNRLVAIFAWEGFAEARHNGWISVTATPASERMATMLVAAAHRIIDHPSMRWVEGGAPWN